MVSKSLRLSAVAAAFAASMVMQPAQADVLATSVIELSNLTFNHTGGAALNAATDFSFLTFQNTGAEAVTYTGTANQNLSGIGTPLDLPLICNGGGCGTSGLTNNGFQPLATVTGNFAAADQNEKGSPILGLGQPLGATVSSGAWGQVQTGANVGNANANNGLQARFTFATNFTGSVDITGNYDYFWKLLLGAGELPGSIAHSSGVVHFGVVDLTTGLTVLDFNPLGLNWDFSFNGPGPIAFGDSNSGSFSTTFAVVAGNNYQLTAREVTLAEVTRAPEPGTLALFALGLLGFALPRLKIKQ